MADTSKSIRAKRRTLLYLSALVLLVSLASSFLFRQREVSIELTKEPAGPPSEITGRDLCPRTGNPKRSTTIQVNFQLEALGKIQNVFQTDTQNFGVRLEIDEVGNPAVLIGRGSSNSFTVIPLRALFKVEKEYTVIIELKSDGEARVFLDGRFEGQNEYVVPQSCRHIALGYGFDASRAMNGKATMTISSLEEKPRIPISQSVRSILVMTALICIVGLRHNSQHPQKGVKVD